jgi:dienelactone hydrolase
LAAARANPLDFRTEFDLARRTDVRSMLPLLPAIIFPLVSLLTLATFAWHRKQRFKAAPAIIPCAGAILLAALWRLGWAEVEYHTLLADWEAGNYRTVDGVVRQYHQLVDGDASFQVGDEWFQLSDRFITSGYNYAAWHRGAIHDGNYVRLAYVARDSEEPFSYFTTHYRGNVIVSWADAEKLFGPAYGADSLVGAAKARGAVIWSEGSDTRDRTIAIADGDPADLAASFRAADWDVFKLDRLIDDTASEYDAAVIAGAAQRLKRQGYSRIVVMGQSAGAWISLAAAGVGDDIDAVVANAPAIYGNGGRKDKNASELYPLLNSVTRARVMLSFFRADDFDPGGRAQRAAEILTRNRVAHLIIDRPVEPTGHGAGSSGLFARRFSRCALALAGTGPVPALDRCTDAFWGRAPSRVMPDSAALSTVVPQIPGSPASRYLGRWYGYFRTGQEVLLVVSKVEGSTVTAEYLVGPAVGDRPSKKITTRIGTLRDTGVVFDGENQATVTLAPLPDRRRLDVTWTEKDGGHHWHAVLHRLGDQEMEAIPHR